MRAGLTQEGFSSIYCGATNTTPLSAPNLPPKKTAPGSTPGSGGAWIYLTFVREKTPL